MEGIFADLTDLLFVSANAEGETTKVEADNAASDTTAMINLFTCTPLDMALIVNRNPVKTLNLFPFNGGRWLTGYIKYNSVHLTDLIGYACRNLLKYFIGDPRPICGHGILGRNWA